MLKNLGMVTMLVLPLSVGFPVMSYSQESESTEAEAEEESHQICRRIRVTGSNIRRRLCLSQVGWDTLASEGRNELRELQVDRSMETRTDDNTDGTLRDDQTGAF